MNNSAQTCPRTWIELSKAAFCHNIAQLKRVCGPVPLGLVVKANAYGHGMHQIAQMAEKHPDIAWLCVAGTSEGVALRQAGIAKPILAMTYLDSDPEEAVKHDIATVLYDLETASMLSAAAVKIGMQARVHIKVDTKMARLGIKPQELTDFVKNVAVLPGIIIEGLFTHLCDTSNPDLTFTHEQLKLFGEAVAAARAVATIPLVHALASGSMMLAGAVAQQQAMARIGTNAFGFWKSAVQQERFEQLYPGISLQPMLEWKSRIIQIKNIEAGETVGYNRAFRATQALTIAIVPVGYVDGYTRALSHKGVVVVAGKEAPVIGIISMNLIIIDVSGISDVLVGMQVLLLGNHPAVTADAISARIGTISNELVSRLNADIPRVILGRRYSR